MFFNHDFLPHILLDETTVFPFLKVHVPKLEPLLDFLKTEHDDFRASLKEFEILFKRFKKMGEQGRPSSGLMGKLRDKGIYIYCLMRNHIQAEGQNIYAAIEKYLNEQEKYELTRQCRRFEATRALEADVKTRAY